MRADGYPPYNIERKGEDTYRITLAIAGLGPDDVEITTEENTLTIRGRAPEAEPAGDEWAFMHRGIPARAFERTFRLPDHIRVTGAEMANGLLDVVLVYEVPEALKPRRVAVTPRRETTIEKLAA